jgi:hypothetical protein
MAEVLPLPIHRLCGAVQEAQQDVLHHICANVSSLTASVQSRAAKVVEPLAKLSENLNNNVMTPLNHQVHGAFAKIHPPTASVRTPQRLSSLLFQQLPIMQESRV